MNTDSSKNKETPVHSVQESYFYREGDINEKY